MDDTATRQVRSFNRSVTQRIGALQDEYLARGRPLGASRVLWEIGDDGSDLRVLRARLDLDSGYLSRLLRSLEQDGLVAVEPGAPDKRVRTVRLTDAGRAERELLDRRSDELAASLLVPLSDAPARPARRGDGRRRAAAHRGPGRGRRRGPRAARRRGSASSPTSPSSTRRFDAGFDPSRSISADAAELTEPAGLLLVARLRGEPIGCGALKLHGASRPRSSACGCADGARPRRRPAHPARARAARAASAASASCAWRPTARCARRAASTARPGYVEVEAFNDEPYAHHWFEKRL